MTDLSAQRRLAADVLDVGKNRVWFDPDAQSDISEAITREDIRELVDGGTIRAEEKRGNSKGRSRERKAKRAYGHQKGPGKRRGKKGGRSDPKKEWQNRIRAQRKKLHELRAEGEIDRTQYRELYNKARGGEFRSVQYLLNYIDNNYGDQ
ncbi:50S ribosomal protein L19e [Haloarchaeobius litoreus]|uniref:Large ribosomal subunit protein eL19 n=1 Tax=Haloarchaeobius litoreus TaxID=755306 RepID=A0ABD6DJ27_9EURY|nr:50S ribosomal protein L19e [Haloarchaeobius litoreus]